MKIVLPEITTVFDCADIEKVNSLVIENQELMLRILVDLEEQSNGNDGKAVLSEQGKTISIEKCLELHSKFVPFDINQKSLINKACALLNQIAVNEDNYLSTMELLGNIERYLLGLTMEMSGNIDFSKVTVENLIKCSGLEFMDDYDSLAEKILDYIELVTEYERKKLFVFVNSRSFISDSDMEVFLENVLQRDIQLLLIDSSEHKLLKNEKRVIIDDNLCEIC